MSILKEEKALKNEKSFLPRQAGSKQQAGKVIYTKYSKHWPYTVAHTIDCVCTKMLNHGLFILLFMLIPASYNELYMS